MQTQYSSNGKVVDTKALDLSAGLSNIVRGLFDVGIDADSYKFSHYCQYQTNATRMMSYIESRGGAYDKVMNFGLQMLIKEYLMGTFTHERVDNLKAFAIGHMGCFDEACWRRVVDVYGGKLPIEIRNAKEGLMIPTGNVLITVETTVDDPEVFSLVSFFETLLLRFWYPATVATKSWYMYDLIYRNLRETADQPDASIPFKLHDFGSRGAAGFQGGAMFGGVGHLVNFMGSDTTVAIAMAQLAYHDDMPAFSIPASEHSTTTSWGVGGEANFVRNMIDSYGRKPNAIYAMVADSYNVKSFVTKTIASPEIRGAIIDNHATYGTTTVIRPDSNDPVLMPIQTIIWLDEVFGSSVNGKGYKVLNHGVRVIQGDGIDATNVDQILTKLKNLGYSGDNIAFGMGGALLQKCDRDTMKFAMKCCAIKVDGEWQDVFKNPIQLAWADGESFDPTVHSGATFKKSKAGRLTLVQNEAVADVYSTIRVEELDQLTGWVDALEPVYRNGMLLRDMTLAEVRANAKASHGF